MSTKYLLPETEKEKNLVTGFLLKLRRLSYEWKNEKGDWFLTIIPEDERLDRITMLTECEYRIPREPLVMPDYVWEIIPRANFIVHNNQSHLWEAHSAEPRIVVGTAGQWQHVYTIENWSRNTMVTAIVGTLTDALPDIGDHDWETIIFKRPEHLKAKPCETKN